MFLACACFSHPRRNEERFVSTVTFDLIPNSFSGLNAKEEGGKDEVMEQVLQQIKMN